MCNILILRTRNKISLTSFLFNKIFETDFMLLSITENTLISINFNNNTFNGLTWLADKGSNIEKGVLLQIEIFQC